ncbi:MAG TPA: hypothetical protein VFO37_00490 [Chitinophagaceae bacterium]|jgi:hypothetical protein|nr:hypothetical protein [Chitinophagaceae bacterium]
MKSFFIYPIYIRDINALIKEQTTTEGIPMYLFLIICSIELMGVQDVSVNRQDKLAMEVLVVTWSIK